MFHLRNLRNQSRFRSQLPHKLNCAVREGVISASKRVKLRSPERADSFLYFLRNHGFSVSQISKLVGSRSELLQFDPEKTLLANIEVLRESGTPQSCISLLMLQSPSVFMLKPKDLGQLVDEIKQIGFDLLKSMSVETIRALCGNNRCICNRNRQVYKRRGWSEDHVLSALRRHPRCMTVGKEDNASTGDFLVKKMGWLGRR